MSAWTQLANSASEVAHSRFARNWSLLVTSNLLVQTLAMLATIRIARALAPQGYGAFNLVQALAVLGALLAGLGTRQVLIRACACEPKRTRQLLAAATALRIVAFAMVGVGIVIYSALGLEELTPVLGFVAVGAMAGLCAWDLLESVAFGHQRMDFSSALGVLGGVVWLVWAWAAPESWLTPVSVSIAFAALQAARVLAYLLLLRRTGWLAAGIQLGARNEWRGLLEPALPFYWLTIVTAVTSQVPILFLAIRAGHAEVGLYNVGFRLVTPLQMLLVTAFTALYPGLSRAATSSTSRFERMVRAALIGTVGLGTAGALLISALSNEVVVLLFGVDYLAAGDAVAALCWYSVLLAVSNLMSTILAARDQQRALAAASTIYVGLSLPIFWFAAGSGANGLAVGLVVTSALGLVFHWLVFQRSGAQPLPTTFGAALASILVLGMGVTWGLARPVLH